MLKHRREFLQAAVPAAIAAPKVVAANDRVNAAFIGVGLMGAANLDFAMKQPGLQVTAVCDVYQPHLEKAQTAARRGGHDAKAVKDFREVLADKSVDIVCISTPDHWHAYMTIEACKAGKDVYVEKPVSLVIDEGRHMVRAARRHNRVVQAGTMQRSGAHFQKAVALVRSGALGKVTFCRTWTHMNLPEEGIGDRPDGEPPPGLDWDLWLGPAARRPFNVNRWGADRTLYPYSQFRYFWDYAGGMMTDWGIHLLDIIQMAFDEQMPVSVTALGGKYWLKDNRETPDTLQVTYEYPGFVATFESRFGNRQMLMGREQQGWFDYGIVFHGSKGTLYLDRAGYRVVPEKGSDLAETAEKSSNSSNLAHWANFLDCVRTRQRPASDIEICHRSSTTAHLGNVALRSGLKVDWDARAETVVQKPARRFLTREYRSPWRVD